MNERNRIKLIIIVANIVIFISFLFWAVVVSDMNTMIIRCVLFGIGFGCSTYLILQPLIYLVKKIESKRNDNNGI